jgi:ADP-ribose pyrophosphatase YjhB (NUDIX family)
MNDKNVQYCIRCGTRLQEMVYHDNHLHLVCPSCDWAYFPDPKVAAAAMVIKDNQILLVKRLFEPMQGHWSLPAGFVNAMEDPARAAERECVEETGLVVQVDELQTVVTGRDHPRGADIVLVYRAHILSGELSAQDDADDAAFFPLDNLPPLAFRATNIALGLAK